MKMETSTYGGTVEWLVGPLVLHDPVPIKVAVPSGEDAGTVVKSGTPLTAAGVSTTGANAVGILLYDVDTAENPNGTVIQMGTIDATKAQAASGVTYAAALTAALPGLHLRTNVGVNS